MAASGSAVVVTGLVEITMDAIYFIAVHFMILLDDVAAAECFDRYQHITHGSRQFRGGETKPQSESKEMRR